jgi:hypothetical protein
MPRKIKNIESLNEEIARLQAKAKGLEGDLNENLDYLQDNYSSLIMNSVFRGAGEMNMKSSVAGTVAGLVLGNERIQAILSKLTTQLLDKAADGLEKLADKFAKKED